MCYNYSKESDIIVLSCILGFVNGKTSIMIFFYNLVSLRIKIK